MATVSMDIAELDKLRASIETEKQNVLNKEQQIKNLEKEIFEVQAEKRVIKITEVPQTVTLGIPYSVHTNHSDLRMIESFISRIVLLNKNDYYNQFNSGYNVKQFNICLGTGGTKRELVNFEDIKEELRKQAEKDVTVELVELRRAKKLADEKLEEVKQEYEKELEKRDKDYKEVIVEYGKQHLKEVEDLQEKLEEAVTGKKKQTEIELLQAKILQLGTDLQREKEKKWYHKLFN